jgi:hypothetical protein
MLCSPHRSLSLSTHVAWALLALVALACGGEPSPDDSSADGQVADEAEAPGGAPSDSHPEGLNPGQGVVTFGRFGPAPGTSAEQLADWTALVRQRFLEHPDSERRAVLDELLAAVPLINATPAFINSLHGLDMGDPDDVQRAHSITSFWYEAQYKYKHVVLDGDPSHMLSGHVKSRLLVCDGWVRLWQRTVDSPGGVSRLNDRVEQLGLDRERVLAPQRKQ